MRKIYSVLISLFVILQSASAQYFKHLDCSVTAGTTGIGLDVASPIPLQIGKDECLQLRAGFAFMPHFNRTMNFGIQAYDAENGLLTTKFDKMAELMHSFTGYNVKDNVDMVGHPTYYNFKLLVDAFPLHDKRWHFTAGFYIGNSVIAKAENSIEDMTSLLSVGMYNRIYDFVRNEMYYDEPIYGDFYLDPEVGDMLRDKMMNYGRMGLHMGDYKDGTPYMLEPDANGMVKAKIKVNRFKPYIGFGYGDVLKGDKKYRISFDCGLMFWGGTPRVVTHDGTDLAHDVENVRGKVGDYVDVAKAFKVFPVLNLCISRRLF